MTCSTNARSVGTPEVWGRRHSAPATRRGRPAVELAAPRALCRQVRAAVAAPVAAAAQFLMPRLRWLQVQRTRLAAAAAAAVAGSTEHSTPAAAAAAADTTAIAEKRFVSTRQKCTLPGMPHANTVAWSEAQQSPAAELRSPLRPTSRGRAASTLSDITGAQMCR